MAAARALGIAGRHQQAGRAVSRRPPPAGRPPVVATSGTPHAMASTAGREKPSYSDGTTATDGLGVELHHPVVAHAGLEA